MSGDDIFPGTQVRIDADVLTQLIEAAENAVQHFGDGDGSKMRLDQAAKRMRASAGIERKAVVRPDVMDVSQLEHVKVEAGRLNSAMHGLALLATNGHGNNLRRAQLKLYGTPPRDSEFQSNEVTIEMDYTWAQDILLMMVRKHKDRLAGFGVKA